MGGSDGRPEHELTQVISHAHPAPRLAYIIELEVRTSHGNPAGHQAAATGTARRWSVPLSKYGVSIGAANVPIAKHYIIEY
jgi:hypothetical protein